jgi:hypothetical protein
MKKLTLLLIMCVSLFIGGMLLASCDKQTACGRADDRCEECSESTEVESCKTEVDACKVLLPGLGREGCCDRVYQAYAQCN